MNSVVTVVGAASLVLVLPIVAWGGDSCPPELAEAKTALKGAQAAVKKGAQATESPGVQAPRVMAGAKSQDVQAPRGQDIQAPRGQDVQAPRAQDIQVATGPGRTGPADQGGRQVRGHSGAASG